MSALNFPVGTGRQVSLTSIRYLKEYDSLTYKPVMTGQ